MVRKIITIHEDKCNGCGQCAEACHEGAIAMVDGKAKLISDTYCDGLGDCLKECPVGAIEIIEREADAYSEETVAAKKKPLPCGCPGTLSQSLKPAIGQPQAAPERGTKNQSELAQWPVQLRLVNPSAPWLNGADILLAADCTAYAYPDIHKDFMRGRVTIIACPKLDDAAANYEKLAAIFANNDIRSVLVLRMEVPCCGGIVQSTKKALEASGKVIPYAEKIVAIKN